MLHIHIYLYKAYVLIRVWNVKFMPGTKKNLKLDIYYHFLIQIWRLELSIRDNICLI